MVGDKQVSKVHVKVFGGVNNLQNQQHKMGLKRTEGGQERGRSGIKKDILREPIELNMKSRGRGRNIVHRCGRWCVEEKRGGSLDKGPQSGAAFGG